MCGLGKLSMADSSVQGQRNVLQNFQSQFSTQSFQFTKASLSIQSFTERDPLPGPMVAVTMAIFKVRGFEI